MRLQPSSPHSAYPAPTTATANNSNADRTEIARRARRQVYRVGEFRLSLFAGMPNTQNINRCRLHLVTYLITADQNTPHFLR